MWRCCFFFRAKDIYPQSRASHRNWVALLIYSKGLAIWDKNVTRIYLICEHSGIGIRNSICVQSHQYPPDRITTASRVVTFSCLSTYILVHARSQHMFLVLWHVFHICRRMIIKRAKVGFRFSPRVPICFRAMPKSLIHRYEDNCEQIWHQCRDRFLANFTVACIEGTEHTLNRMHAHGRKSDSVENNTFATVAFSTVSLALAQSHPDSCSYLWPTLKGIVAKCYTTVMVSCSRNKRAQNAIVRFAYIWHLFSQYMSSLTVA